MVNRPAGGARSVRHKREPHDWYCEDARPVDQLMDAVDFRDDLIFDPTCGRGNILDVAKRRGHATVGSDLFERRCGVTGSLVSARHPFSRGNVMQLRRPPSPAGRALSVMNNPPYSYEDDIAERIIRRVLGWPYRLAAFLVPIAFVCSNDRWIFFSHEHPPLHVAVLSERPSMPPGPTLTPATEFKGGMADYIWLIYRYGHQGPTTTIWLRPSGILPPAKSRAPGGSAQHLRRT
jgi:hypothetical protein